MLQDTNSKVPIIIEHPKKNQKRHSHNSASSLLTLFQVADIIPWGIRHLAQFALNTFNLDVLFTPFMPPPQTLDFHRIELLSINLPFTATNRDL